MEHILDAFEKGIDGVLVAGCLEGGAREVGIMAYAIRMARRLEGKPIQIEQVTIERQCENEFIKDLAPAVERNEAVLSFACGGSTEERCEVAEDRNLPEGLAACTMPASRFAVTRSEDAPCAAATAYEIVMGRDPASAAAG